MGSLNTGAPRFVDILNPLPFKHAIGREWGVTQFVMNIQFCIYAKTVFAQSLFTIRKGNGLYRNANCIKINLISSSYVCN